MTECQNCVRLVWKAVNSTCAFVWRSPVSDPDTEKNPSRSTISSLTLLDLNIPERLWSAATGLNCLSLKCWVNGQPDLVSIKWLVSRHAIKVSSCLYGCFQLVKGPCLNLKSAARYVAILSYHKDSCLDLDRVRTSPACSLTTIRHVSWLCHCRSPNVTALLLASTANLLVIFDSE